MDSGRFFGGSEVSFGRQLELPLDLNFHNILDCDEIDWERCAKPVQQCNAFSRNYGPLN
ncbi:hypothetical protein AKJ16_DCAP21577 [Drosera capensis]